LHLYKLLYDKTFKKIFLKFQNVKNVTRIKNVENILLVTKDWLATEMCLHRIQDASDANNPQLSVVYL